MNVNQMEGGDLYTPLTAPKIGVKNLNIYFFAILFFFREEAV